MAKKALQSLDEAEEERKPENYDVRLKLSGGGSVDIVSPIPANQLYREMISTLSSKSGDINFTGWYAFLNRQKKFSAINIMHIVAIEEI